MENVKREKIAEFLLKLRKENGLTQEQMAKIMYVSEKTIRNWEQGKTLPNMEDLVMIVNTFSVSLESVFKGECDKDEKMQIRLNELDDSIDTIVSRVSINEKNICSLKHTIGSTNPSNNNSLMWLILFTTHTLSAAVYFMWYHTGHILPVYAFLCSCLYIFSVLTIIILNRKSQPVLSVISIYSLLCLTNMYVNYKVFSEYSKGVIYNAWLAFINGPVYGLSYICWNNMDKLKNISIVMYSAFIIICVAFIIYERKEVFVALLKRHKKLIIIRTLASMFIVTSITAFKPVGDISGVRVDIQDSNIFSEEDFSKAVEVIKSNFKRNGRGCRLLKIKYIGDSANESVGCKSVVERYNLRKYIVFEITREVSNRFFQSDLSGVHYHYNLWIGTKDGYNWAIIDGGGV